MYHGIIIDQEFKDKTFPENFKIFGLTDFKMRLTILVKTILPNTNENPQSYT